jgi:hypothetical protein
LLSFCPQPINVRSHFLSNHISTLLSILHEHIKIA